VTQTGDPPCPKAAAKPGAPLIPGSSLFSADWTPYQSHQQARRDPSTAETNQNRALSSKDVIGLAFRYAKGPRFSRGSLQTSRNILKSHQLSEKLHAPLLVGWFAGRTANHYRNWEAITSDKWVLQAVGGYQLEFVNIPTKKQAPMTCASKKLSELISQEIEAMIQKNAVEEVDPGSSEEGFYSRLFLVPKKASISQ